MGGPGSGRRGLKFELLKKLEEAGYKNVEDLQELSDNKAVDPSIRASIKKFLVEHVVGKPKQQVDVTTPDEVTIRVVTVEGPSQKSETQGGEVEDSSSGSTGGEDP